MVGCSAGIVTIHWLRTSQVHKGRQYQRPVFAWTPHSEVVQPIPTQAESVLANRLPQDVTELAGWTQVSSTPVDKGTDVAFDREDE